MWSPSASRWHVGLSAGKVVRVRLAGAWRQRIGSFDELVCAPGTGEAPWLAATVELTRLLQDDTVRPRSVCIVLSGRFVRWQLLAWHPELARQEEVAAHARLRFAETPASVGLEWSMVLTLAVLVSPLSWTYFFCWLLPGWAAAVHFCARADRPWVVRRRFIAACAVAGVLLVSAITEQFDPTLQAYGVTAWGAVALFLTLAAMRRVEGRERAARLLPFPLRAQPYLRLHQPVG